MKTLFTLLIVFSILTINSMPTAWCQGGDAGTNGNAQLTKTGKTTRHGGKVALEAETAPVRKVHHKAETSNRDNRKRNEHSEVQGNKLSKHKSGHHHQEQQEQAKGNKPSATPISRPSAAILSDLRVKTNISFVGWSPAGIPIYQFSYISEPNKRYQGTIAQAISRLRPEAVISRNGLMYVDYSRLDVRMEELPPASEADDGCSNK